jgi:hypothetical protein
VEEGGHGPLPDEERLEMAKHLYVGPFGKRRADGSRTFFTRYEESGRPFRGHQSIERLYEIVWAALGPDWSSELRCTVLPSDSETGK